jgi:hypothetical protein
MKRGKILICPGCKSEITVQDDSPCPITCPVCEKNIDYSNIINNNRTNFLSKWLKTQKLAKLNEMCNM